MTTGEFTYQLRVRIKNALCVAGFKSWVKKKDLRFGVKIEGICNALSLVKLNTSAIMEVFILDRFWDEMLDAYNEVTLVKYNFTSSR